MKATLSVFLQPEKMNQKFLIQTDFSINNVAVSKYVVSRFRCSFAAIRVRTRSFAAKKDVYVCIFRRGFAAGIRRKRCVLLQFQLIFEIKNILENLRKVVVILDQKIHLFSRNF